MNIPATTFGLCAGRHEIPVKGYIFQSVENVLDFTELNRIAEQFVVENCHPEVTIGDGGPAAIGYTDVACYKGKPLDVVVTGLTPCTTSVMWACACYGVKLTLWHYNRETGDYVPQKFNF